MLADIDGKRLAGLDMVLFDTVIYASHHHVYWR